MRIREIAQVRVRYGYRKIRVLLNREGWKVGKYLVERIYREEGLTLQQRRKRRRRVAEHRRERFHPTGPNQVWSMDFVADQLADGSRFRSLTVVDIYTRECLAIESVQKLKGEDVVRTLNRIKVSRGAPKMVHCDNGSDFAVRRWTCGRTSTECAWRSRGRGNQPTMPSWRPSMERSGQKCLNAH
jgi:putative transposase